MYKGNPLQQKFFSHTSYPSILKDYLPFSIHNKTYLVYRGCGAVLEWRNDSIVRVDNSFLHRNQFFASTFTYNNKIYFFGGYGLFTYKNILTKYNLKSKEWEEEETFGVPPSPRRLALSVIVKDDLFVFGGYEKDESNFSQNKEVKPIIWKLHLPSMKWSQVGRFNSALHINTKDGIASSFTANNKLYLIPLMEYSYTFEIDLKNNTITTFKGKPKSVEQSFFDYKTKEVVYIHKDGDGFKSLMRMPLQEFLGKPINQQKFILPWYQSVAISTIILLVFGVLFLIGLLRYFQQKKKRFIPFTGIIYYATKEAFYYRGKLLDSFEDAELRILDYLIQNKNRFISLNELNHLFENEVQKDSFLTVVKRREVALANLLAKLSFISSMEEQNILDYRRSANDKRVKEIKLKDSFIKVK